MSTDETKNPATDISRQQARDSFYVAEVIAKRLTEDLAILEEAAAAAKAERAQMPDKPPADYGGVAQEVVPEDRQNLSPAANDNRPPNPHIQDVPRAA